MGFLHLPNLTVFYDLAHGNAICPAAGPRGVQSILDNRYDLGYRDSTVHRFILHLRLRNERGQSRGVHDFLYVQLNLEIRQTQKAYMISAYFDEWMAFLGS